MSTTRKTIQMKLGTLAFAIVLGLMTLNVAFANIARVPLFVTEGGLPPNILLILDNSNTMVENLDGSVAAGCDPGVDADCVAGAAHPDSKSEMIRSVARSLVSDYREQINLGLMAYQQYSPGGSWEDAFDDDDPRVVIGELHDRLYDVSYDPANYDEDFSGSPWDSDTKMYRVENPSDPGGYIHYNIGVPGYASAANERYCTTTQPGGGYLTEPFPFRCFSVKEGASDLLPTNDEDYRFGYSDYDGGTTGNLSDSARARGVTHWGQRMVQLPYNHPEWVAIGSPGLGYLHTPVRLLDDEHAEKLNLKLAPQHHEYSNNLFTDPDEPLIAAGLTPLQGTLLTARDYFTQQTDYFSNSQGRRPGGEEASYPIPESCDANAAIWLTDGMPSVDKDGVALGDDVEQALSDAIDAAEALHIDALMDLFVVGFSMPPAVSGDALDRLAAAGGTGEAYLAGDDTALQDAMEDIFDLVIRDARSSAASIATNSTRLDTESLAFLASFDTTDWSGELQAYEITQEGVLGDLRWEAEDGIPDAFSRNIITWDPEDGDTLHFEWDHPSGRHLTDAQKAALNTEPYTGDVDGQGQDRLWWLRGDQTNEGEGAFRERERLLGDIVNSDPIFVQTQDFGYYHEENFDGGLDYRAHVTAMREHRPMLYLAANDGKLHGFDAETGEEVFAYVPDAVMHKLNRLTSPDYEREYYFDGSPRVGDVWDGNNWRRVLVGSFGAGERGVYALDITDPESPEVLWEATADDFDDIGYVIGQPTIGITQSDDWVVAVPSGYESNNDRAALTFLDPISGDEIETWTPDDDDNPAGNGMATPIPVDINGDRKMDRVYMGDLEGQLWRVDLTGNNWRAPGGLRSGNTPLPLFVAEGPDGNRQPITVRPQVARSPEGEVFVYFGTGKYFEDEDNLIPNNPPVQSFYGIRDDEAAVGRGDLLEQEIIEELEDFGFELRVTTEHEITDEDGWFMDLVSPDPVGRQGERVIFNPVFRNGRIIFTTMVPSMDPCAAGGDGWLMEIDAFSGGRLPFSPFDLSGSGEFGEDSYVEVDIDGERVRVPISGIRSRVGIPTTPAIISAGPQEFKMMMGSEAEMQELPPEKGDDTLGRQSWRQNR